MNRRERGIVGLILGPIVILGLFLWHDHRVTTTRNKWYNERLEHFIECTHGNSLLDRESKYLIPNIKRYHQLCFDKHFIRTSMQGEYIGGFDGLAYYNEMFVLLSRQASRDNKQELATQLLHIKENITSFITKKDN